MLNLQRVTMFIAVVDAGSFTLAAAALGQTKAVVSFNVRQLENELGVTLLLRSTRRLRLTDAGVLFYQRYGADELCSGGMRRRLAARMAGSQKGGAAGAGAAPAGIPFPTAGRVCPLSRLAAFADPGAGIY